MLFDQQSKLAHDVLRNFAMFAAGDMSLKMFEQWVYTTPNIADIVGYDQYVQLLDLEYRLPSAHEEAVSVVTQMVDQPFPDELLREQVRLVLCGLINGTFNVFEACDKLAWWHHEGVLWIPIIFVGIESELDSAPHPAQYNKWEPSALAAKLAEVEPWVSSYRNLAQAEARQLLATKFPERLCEQE